MLTEAIKVAPYEASGGASAVLEIQGHTVRIQAHEASFALTLPTKLNAFEAWKAVASLLSRPTTDGEAVLLQCSELSAAEGIEELEKASPDLRFVRLDLDEHVFTWRALRDSDMHEVGIGFEHFDAQTFASVVRVAGASAVREVADDVTAIAKPLLTRYN